MKSNLARYEIVRDIAQSENLDLLRVGISHGVVPYRSNLPLKELSIGYWGKRPTNEDIDRIFSAYDTIEARLNE